MAWYPQNPLAYGVESFPANSLLITEDPELKKLTWNYYAETKLTGSCLAFIGKCLEEKPNNSSI